MVLLTAVIPVNDSYHGDQQTTSAGFSINALMRLTDQTDCCINGAQ